jgi:thiol-disulfide isomerase/thioredoxin
LIFYTAFSKKAMYKIQYIGATWCTSCKVIQPKIDDLSKKFAVPLTVHDLEELPQEEQDTIVRVPTIRIYKDATILHVYDKNQVASVESWLKETILVGNAEDF